MKDSDFYFVFNFKNQSACPKDELYKGTNIFGDWHLSIKGTREILPQNVIIFRTGLASDRKSPRFEIKIFPENIEISCEKFGISPIYYSSTEKELHLSSDINILSNNIKSTRELNVNKRFLLEQNLFNYSLFNNTIFEEIKLLPSNSVAIIKDKMSIRGNFHIEEYFVDDPVPYRYCIHNLTDLFISLNADKIHNEDYISFTSGFDGRSLLALALSLGKKIRAYSFGIKRNIDLFLPEKQAALLGVDFWPILLDDNIYLDNFLNIGEKLLTDTAANSNFLQLHWQYAAKILSEKTSTVVTGIFGSELFRSVHIAGQMISPAMSDYFKHLNSDMWITKLKNSNSLKFLNKENFRKEIEDLIDDLQDYKTKNLQLSENQRLYKYMYDETFRKFFGMQFIQPMRSYVDVISPYLDWEFIKELLKTELAGVNNTLFSENPLKRMKGQLFYAELIRRTSPELYLMPTGKGYAPGDLQCISGKLKLVGAFTYKRLHRKVFLPDLDNLKIVSGVGRFKNKIISSGINKEYYNKSFLQLVLDSGNWTENEMIRDKFVETLSTNYFLNKVV